jgi:hypothetical protein
LLFILVVALTLIVYVPFLPPVLLELLNILKFHKGIPNVHAIFVAFLVYLSDDCSVVKSIVLDDISYDEFFCIFSATLSSVVDEMFQVG